MFGWLESDDIAEGDYSQLLDVCFENAPYFSFIELDRELERGSGDDTLVQLQPFLLLKQPCVTRVPGYAYQGVDDIAERWAPARYVYSCCEKASKVLKKNGDSLFCWSPRNGKPEDLCFYTEEKRALLYTVAHESICEINCNNDMFQQLLRCGQWSESCDSYFFQDVYF